MSEINDSPVEQVRLTIPITDDPNLPVLTVRAWVMGIIFCMLESSLLTFTLFRQNQFFVPTIIWQMAAFPLGKFLAAVLPAQLIRIPGTKFEFSLNPGPFNVKEHGLIAIMADAGVTAPVLIKVMAALRTIYGIKLKNGLLVVLTIASQMMGFGLAGLFLKFLVDNPHMWWPSSLVNVVFYRSLHQPEKRAKGALTRFQFLLIVTAASFAYGLFSDFLSPVISEVSWVCLAWKKSVLAQQLGSGHTGLGLGSFGLSWDTITWAKDPFTTPAFALHNSMFGFVLAAYIITPFAYYRNVFKAKRFPIISSKLFDKDGKKYLVSKAMKNESFDLAKYKSYSPVYLSAFQVFQYGLLFASSTSAIVHLVLQDGKSLWPYFTRKYQLRGDVHNRLMEKYKKVPKWWFGLLFLVIFSASVYICHIGFAEEKEVKLSFGFLLFVVAYSVFITIPNGIMIATTNQKLPTALFGNLIIGYVNKGHSFQNMIFRSFCVDIPNHIGMFLEMFKFGHYMKIPPRMLFIALVSATGVASVCSLGTALILFEQVKGMCQPDELPAGSPWTCPNVAVFSTTTAIWNTLGPSAMFYPHGVYGILYWFFLGGAVATLVHWLLTRIYPRNGFLRGIHLPLILVATANTPPAGAVQWWSAYIVGVFLNVYVYNYHRWWWIKYNYLFSGAGAMGSSLSILCLFLAFQMHGVQSPNYWGTMVDQCPHATCPTDKTILSNFPSCPSPH